MKTTIKYLSLAVAASVLFISAGVAQQQNLSLQDAVDLARRNNPEIKASQLDIEKSRQEKIISRSLYLPSIYANAQVSHYFQRTPFFGFGVAEQDEKIPYGRFGGEDQFGAGVTAIQPLFNPHAIPSIQQARLKERESEIALNERQIGTLSLVKQTYLQLLVLKERIKLQEESIRRNQRVLQDARVLFIQGKALRVDTLRAYTAVRNLEPGLLKLSYAVETGKLQLKTLIGLDSLQDVVLVDSLVLPDPGTIPNEEEVYDAARNNNPEFQLVALREQISEQQINVASATRLPVLSAIGQYQVQSQANNFEYGNAYYPSSSFVGLQLSVPIFTGFSNQAKIKQARFTKTQTSVRSKLAYEQLRSRVHQVVADNHESLTRLQTTASVQETAQLSYDIIQYRYKKGISSRLELTDAELELTTAQSNYLEAVYDYLSSQIALLKLMGKVE